MTLLNDIQTWTAACAYDRLIPCRGVGVPLPGGAQAALFRLDAGIAPSTGGVGDSFDNALAENLWSTIKVELIYWPATTFATRAEAQAALFRLDDGTVHAVGNIDPFSGAAVLSRGIVGDRGGRPTVQSPIKKQAFALDDGACLDDPTVAVSVYQTRITAGGIVEICA